MAISICPALPAASTANGKGADRHALGLHAMMTRRRNPVEGALSPSSAYIAMVNRARK
jgi:hypothetical protein